MKEEIERLKYENHRYDDALRMANKNIDLLMKRIDKALEYIYQNSCLDEYNGNIVENYKYELENILKGEDK